MFDALEWNRALEAARAGDPRAADRLARMLIEWTQNKLRGRHDEEKNDIEIAFVEHMFRDGFAHLPVMEPDRWEAFLSRCLVNFVIDWARWEKRHREREVLQSQRPVVGGEDEEDPAPERFAGSVASPEGVVILRAQCAEIRSVLAGMSELKQLIFHLFFEEETPEEEIGRLLGIARGTVAWHLSDIRERLRRALADRWA